MNKDILNLLDNSKFNLEDNSNVFDINIAILENAIEKIKSDELILLARDYGIKSRILFYELLDLYACIQWLTFNEIESWGNTEKYKDLHKLELLLETEVKHVKNLYFRCLNIERKLNKQTKNYIFGTNSRPTEELTKKIRLSAFNNSISVNSEKEYKEIINEKINNFLSASYKNNNIEILTEALKPSNKIIFIQQDKTIKRKIINDPTYAEEFRGTRDIYYLNLMPDPKLIKAIDLFIQRYGGYYEIPNTIEGWQENKITLVYFPSYTLCPEIENELATNTKTFGRDVLTFGKQINNQKKYEINPSIKKTNIPYDFEIEELIAKGYSLDPVLGNLINTQANNHSLYFTDEKTVPIEYRIIKLFIDYLEISILPAFKIEFITSI
jgi:hypothetical protein